MTLAKMKCHFAQTKTDKKMKENGRKLRVLSLFDGMSCGQIALKEAEIDVEVYFASEIDKYAIAQTMLNFPSTMQIGSVVDVDPSLLGWIDLLIGGSPCQSFSFAGKRKGMATKCAVEITSLEQYLGLKVDGFEFEGQSYLFWEYMRVLEGLRKVNPGIKFLLENVEMGAKWEMVLSRAIGIRGVHINSALVSAQNRKRIYWTNIRTVKAGFFEDEVADIPQPEDRGVLLRDILEEEVDEKYFIKTESMLNFVTDKWRLDKSYTQINGEKSLPEMARMYASWCSDYIDENICVAQRGRDGVQQIEPASGGKTNCLTSVQKDNLVMTANYLQITGTNFDSDNRFWKEEGKHASVLTRGIDKTGVLTQSHIRRLTPTECARLQTIPDWYKWECSATQQYRMLGNGWTVEVIKHIFKYLKQ